jgi:hypothetical protein
VSTLTQTMSIAAVRPTNPARRALLALAEVLARIALHRADHHALAMQAEVAERRERDANRLRMLTSPLR